MMMNKIVDDLLARNDQMSTILVQSRRWRPLPSLTAPGNRTWNKAYEETFRNKPTSEMKI